jgi:glycosyltransferase involved in cell wall biosynthesis
VSTPLWAVLPGGIDDPATPSGGNRYDRTVLDLLDRAVHEIAIGGSWPTPGDLARRALETALGDIPDKSDVLIDGLVACGVPEILEPHRHRLRLIVLVHLPLGDETGLSSDEARRLRALERSTLHLAARVVATSRAAAVRISEIHDLSPRQDIAVATPGVAPAEGALPDQSGSRLLCVAAVTPRKGQDLLVSVLEGDLGDLRWTCTFAGAVTTPVAHENGSIRFVGALYGRALDDAYRETDVLVLPSRAETYGMVVTEALARGLPVIATEVGGVPEAMGHAPDGSRPGMLVPPDDREALAGALRAWLTDAGLRERLRASARGRRDTLPTWTETARRLSEVLDDRGVQ